MWGMSRAQRWECFEMRSCATCPRDSGLLKNRFEGITSSLTSWLRSPRICILA